MILSAPWKEEYEEGKKGGGNGHLPPTETPTRYMHHIIADPPCRAINSETKAPQENSKKKIVFHAITATPPCDDLGVHLLRI